MRYQQDKACICMGGDEVVFFARNEHSVSFTGEELGLGLEVSEARRLQLTGFKDREILYKTLEHGGYQFEIAAGVDAIEDVTLTFLCKVATHLYDPDEETVKQLRGEAFLAGHIFAQETGRTPHLRMIYYSDGSLTPKVVEETPDKSSLQTFFDRLMDAACLHALPEIERVTKRLPTLKEAKFPFPNIRDGQRELMETVYRTVKRGEKLYACAPTGIGKTMSVLYPAIRALGEGHVEKVFYLTPKNTTAQAACDALVHLKGAGADVRGIRLVAKEKICPYQLICREGIRCALSNRAPGREDEAARELLSYALPVIGEGDILKVARKWGVCPYELSLRYSMYCDVIICDYNYLFDLRVYLRRYFDKAGSYAFLVDEAHNLVERAREMYAVRYDSEYLDTLTALTKDIPHMHRAVAAFRQWFEKTMEKALKDETNLDKNGVPYGFYSTSELPEGMYTNVCNLACAIADLPRGTVPESLERELRPLGFDLLHDVEKLGLYDKGFQVFYERQGDYFILRTPCQDPAAPLASRLEKGHSAVFFSATLTPTDYYRDVLGGDSFSRTLEVPSPFDHDRLCVAVMDKISTRYTARGDTVRQVVRAILTTVKAKPGNYMVFCPSYAYMMAVVEDFRKAMPALPILVQEKDMSQQKREEFLEKFEAHPKKALVGFCVMGGIYSEGIDLVGKRLIGAIIVGVGLPTISNDREAIRVYYDDKIESGKEYAYTYPGMNRVLQAAGRVIRTEEDRGVVLLIDDRFATPEYTRLIPPHWRGLRYVGDTAALERYLTTFWQKK